MVHIAKASVRASLYVVLYLANEIVEGSSNGVARMTMIIGEGIVGYNIAARLVEEGHDVTVVDEDDETLEQVGGLVQVVKGLDLDRRCGKRVFTR